MQIYLVGGAVRDNLLGLPVKERDYVVVGASAAQLSELGFVLIDQTFPVFKHPLTGDEYALARRESKIACGYKGFKVEFGLDVTIKEDLARRDLTINAIAVDESGNIIDPYNGIEDLHTRRLRHITPAFADDPVRLLRIARFAAQFWHLGFRITHSTLKLLQEMAQPNEIQSLMPQLMHKIMLRALATASPWRFFLTLQRANALVWLLPELAAAMGETPPHSTNAPSLPMLALQRATAITTNIAVRLAALLATVVLTPIAAVTFCNNLKIERNISNLVILAVTWPASRVVTASPPILMEILETNRFLHAPEKLTAVTQVWQAVEPILGNVATTRLTTALQVASAIRAEHIQEKGLTGAALGAALRHQRIVALAHWNSS